MNTFWVQITLKFATFALGIRDGTIVEAAPIAKWTLGKDERFVADYYRRRGATFNRLPDE